MSLHVIHIALAVIFIASVSLANDKLWPDFTCHPNHDSEAEQKDTLAWNQKLWNDCKYDSAESGKNSCVKACMLGSNRMFNHYPDDNNGSDEDINTFIDLLVRSNGYKNGAGGEPAKKLMDKVREGLKKCVKDHPELKKLSMDDTCVKWDPFLTCVTNVIVRIGYYLAKCLGMLMV